MWHIWEQLRAALRGKYDQNTLHRIFTELSKILYIHIYDNLSVSPGSLKIARFHMPPLCLVSSQEKLYHLMLYCFMYPTLFIENIVVEEPLLSEIKKKSNHIIYIILCDIYIYWVTYIVRLKVSMKIFIHVYTWSLIHLCNTEMDV